jgi:G3E family GTPase
MGILKKVKLDTLITLVDAEAFLRLFGTDQKLSANRKLAYGDNPMDMENDGNAQRMVTELLLEQVECADIVLVNKVDLLVNTDSVELVKKVVDSVNPTAKVLTCVRGEVADPLHLVGSYGEGGMANSGILDEHRSLVATASKAMLQEARSGHDHAHKHGHDHKEPFAQPSHSHDHQHSTTSANPTSSSADHEHSHVRSSACHDATCADTTHDHDHIHDSDTTTAEKRFGITSFVYRRRRPFHPFRFSSFLNSLGKLSVRDLTDITPLAVSAPLPSEAIAQARKALLRSKGFVWMGHSKLAAFFMSHAGQYLELNVLGRWWADIPREQWPQGLEQEIALDFDGSHGDKRQEIVFIGQFGGNERTRKSLEDTLDMCLLNDEEMKMYDELSKNKGEEALKEYFTR